MKKKDIFALERVLEEAVTQNTLARTIAPYKQRGSKDYEAVLEWVTIWLSQNTTITSKSFLDFFKTIKQVYSLPKTGKNVQQTPFGPRDIPKDPEVDKALRLLNVGGEQGKSLSFTDVLPSVQKMAQTTKIVPAQKTTTTQKTGQERHKAGPPSLLNISKRQDMRKAVKRGEKDFGGSQRAKAYPKSNVPSLSSLTGREKKKDKPQPKKDDTNSLANLAKREFEKQNSRRKV